MKKYIIEYKNGERNTSIAVVDKRSLIQLAEVIENNYCRTMVFELEDGLDNAISLRTDSIVAIYSLGNRKEK